MNREGVGSVVLALVLAVTVMGGGLLHAAIPHNDGDDHGGQGGASVIWDSLHSNLRHDEKKFLYVVTDTLLVIVLCSVGLLLLRLTFPSARLFAHIRLRDPVLGEALRRGVLPHRAFP
jgi:hypothetical protein